MRFSFIFMAKKTKKNIFNLEDLAQEGFIESNAVKQLEEVTEKFSLSMTSQMGSLIEKQNNADPIALQFIPQVKELDITEQEHEDPISDGKYTTVKGIIHRYPDRCLFTPVHVCPVYCRFCFRREKLGPDSEALTPKELETAYEYLASHPEIFEVILTGGDPLILKPAKLRSILDRLAAISHIEIIRIHSRVPVVEPKRINKEMISALKINKPVYVVLHANHPNEFGTEAKQACAHLVDNGIPMLSQTVLLKGINDDIETLSNLMRCFLKNRIKPYYLHQGDLAQGTKHFRTTIKKGQSLMKALRGRFSGLCQPLYVLDIPGGYGKVPIAASYLQENVNQQEHFIVEDYNGNFHEYSTDSEGES